jgi:hypothetical protein
MDGVAGVAPPNIKPMERPPLAGSGEKNVQPFDDEIGRAKQASGPQIVPPQLAATQTGDESVVSTATVLAHMDNPLHDGFHVGITAHRIAGSDDPAVKDALKLGTESTSSRGETTSAHLRLIKILQVGASQTAKIYEQYPGGPAMLEMSYSASGGIGGRSGKGVEGNIGPTHKQLPGTGKEVTSTFGEFVFRTHQLGLEQRREYTFYGRNGISGREEAEQFLKNFQQTKVEQFSPTQLLPDSWVQSGIDQVYSQYTNGQMKASGGEYHLNWSPASGKIYGSTSFDGFAPVLNRAGIKIPPKTGWVADALSYGIGLYGEASATPEVSLKYTWDNKDINAITVQTEDLDPGAPGAIILQGKVDYRVLGAFSVGHYPVAQAFAEGTHMGGAGIVLDDHGWPAQSILSYEGHLNLLTPGAEQRFRDVRINDLSKPMSFQGQYANLDMTRTAAKFEIRGNLSLSSTPREFLIDHHRTQLEYAGPHRRFDAINVEMGGTSPLTPQWETAAREAYVKDVAGGAAVSDQDWNGLLHDGLTDRWYEYVTESRPFQAEKAAWEARFFSDQHKEAYARWDGISQRLMQEREAEVNGMSQPALYKAYSDEGLRYPGVYIGIHQGTKDETIIAGGASFGKAADGANMMKNLKGLAKVTYKTDENSYREVGNLAIDHGAYAHADRILKDPLAAPGFIALMNRSAYPRRDANGNFMEIGPAARLMYHGFTPTREIDGLLTDTGLKARGRVEQLSKMTGVFKVGPNEGFTDIGRRALGNLTGQSVTDQDAAAYGEMVRNLNFPRMSAQEAAGHIFDGALIVLPSPRATP